MSDQWQEWKGGAWNGDPDALVSVRFQDGSSDEHLSPRPAKEWGVDPREPSNWRRVFGDNSASIVAYRLADAA